MRDPGRLEGGGDGGHLGAALGGHVSSAAGGRERDTGRALRVPAGRVGDAARCGGGGSPVLRPRGGGVTRN